MDVFVARQPVFDRHQDVYAYELFFRAGFRRYFRAVDAVEVLRAEKTSVDLMDFVHFDQLTDGRRGLVQFTRELLTREIPRLLPSEMVVVGLPADIDPDDEEILAACRRLRDSGYLMSMQGTFSLRRPNAGVVPFADVIRVNFARTDEADREAVAGAFGGKTILLAQGLADHRQLEQAQAMGYDRFQGDFFRKPVVTPARELSESKLAYLRVLREVNRPELSLDELEACVKQDVAIVYNLLRFMNSAWLGLRHEVHSIKHALILLGPKEIRKWFSLLVLRNAGEHKPDELLLRSLTRAKVGEMMAQMAGLEDDASDLFLMGMFSLIDALTDRPMQDIMDSIWLNERIKNALLAPEEGGRFSLVLQTILGYEYGNWDRFAAAAAQLEVHENAMPDLFRQASSWATGVLKEV